MAEKKFIFFIFVKGIIRGISSKCVKNNSSVNETSDKISFSSSF